MLTVRQSQKHKARLRRQGGPGVFESVFVVELGKGESLCFCCSCLFILFLFDIVVLQRVRLEKNKNIIQKTYRWHPKWCPRFVV